jgi:hypothetical protein
MDEDLDEMSEPGGLAEVSGMWVRRALKKLYNCQHTTRRAL